MQNKKKKEVEMFKKSEKLQFDAKSCCLTLFTHGVKNECSMQELA